MSRNIAIIAFTNLQEFGQSTIKFPKRAWGFTDSSSTLQIPMAEAQFIATMPRDRRNGKALKHCCLDSVH